MNKAVSPAAPWGDLESSRGRRCLAAGRLGGRTCPALGPRGQDEEWAGVSHFRSALTPGRVCPSTIVHSAPWAGP